MGAKVVVVGVAEGGAAMAEFEADVELQVEVAQVLGTPEVLVPGAAAVAEVQGIEAQAMVRAGCCLLKCNARNIHLTIVRYTYPHFP